MFLVNLLVVNEIRLMMKKQKIKYLVSVGILLATASTGFAQSSASHNVQIVVLRPNEMTLAENVVQKDAVKFNLNWKSHNQGSKITVVSENNILSNNLKIVASDISGKTNRSEIPITNVSANLVNGNRSNNGNCQFQLITNISRRKNKNEIQPTIMYTLTDA